MIWLSRLGVAILFSIGVAGIKSVCTTYSIPLRSHYRQVYLGRMVLITLIWAGTNSRASLLLSPILCKSLWLQSQAFSLSSISTTTYLRGSAIGKGLRFGLILGIASVFSLVRNFLSCSSSSNSTSLNTSSVPGIFLIFWRIRWQAWDCNTQAIVDKLRLYRLIHYPYVAATQAAFP